MDADGEERIIGYAYGAPWVAQALLMDDIRFDTPEKQRNGGIKTVDKTELTWNVYIGDYNARTIRIHNIFNHSGFLDDLKKAARKYKDTERDQFEDQMRKSLLYYYWSKCEWEVIIDHWPPKDDFHDKKVDVYEQVRLNWGPFCDYVWSHRAVLRRREKKGE